MSVALFAVLFVSAAGAAPVGYYRQPALHGDTIVFVAEGDLWRVGVDGGTARRLTSHPGNEGTPAISPDGKTVAFVGHYEGPAEVYTMPLEGGLPVRRTYGAAPRAVVGWTPAGEVLFSSSLRSTLPDRQVLVLHLDRPGAVGGFEPLPLAQAADGAYDASGTTFYFTRFAFQGSHTKRYKGGTAQKIWSYTDGAPEATPLTAEYPGTSKRPWPYRGRIYFTSDRDGTMNLWSMAPDGSDLRPHTHHEGWDVAGATLEGGRIVYQLGADLYLYDIADNTDRKLDITIDSDLDQLREHWVKKPSDYLTASHIAFDGEAVALTARGRVFTVPRKQGRLVEVARSSDVRYRAARFMPDGKTLLALSDRSGEVEFWRLPANGVGEPEQLTDDADMIRWDGIPSPDGAWVAHFDKRQRLFLLNVETRRNRKIAESRIDAITDVAWSPDSRWLAYVMPAENLMHRIYIHDTRTGESFAVTTDRYDSFSPSFGTGGKWLYFLSDRHLVTAVKSVWGSYQPEPFLDAKTRIYQIALTPGLRSPFAPDTELETTDGDAAETSDSKDDEDEEESVSVTIDREGIARRLVAVPVPPGNFTALEATGDALYWLALPFGDKKATLFGLKIGNEKIEVEIVADGLDSYELSGDGKRFLLRKSGALYITDAAPAKATLEDARVDLSGWNLSVDPRREWRQMFVEAWRLERDYFYDRNMNGVDWPAMLRKYRPLVERVTTRAELSDVLSQMVGELSALHIFVYGGDRRTGPDDVEVASLGAVLVRDEDAGGYRVRHVYRADPDEPDRLSPLERIPHPVPEGAVILAVNGVGTLDVADASRLLRGQAGRQVLLHLRDASGERDAVVEPITARAERTLRYDEWEYTRRLRVEEAGNGDIGYVHLRAMGSGNFTEWAKNFYPVFNRKGLIVDVRHNRGGNIDSWILGRLLRKAWHFWSQPVGWSPTWNMQYAFRGHVVVLCDAHTASDGEDFAEGFRRLGLGEVIGTRTWGGEIWLSSSNFLVDGGIATAAEYGVYGPEGRWLIEGRGVEPDVVVDNPPHATFEGEDAQLDEAVRRLRAAIAADPVEEPLPPAFPDKSFPGKR